MYRSWAYILMMVATLIGAVALVWPSPQVRTIEEIAMTPPVPPRAETAGKSVKPVKPAPGAKPPSKAAAASAPPAVIKRIPPQNTSTKRAGPLLQNGMEPGLDLGGLKPGDPLPAGTPKPVKPPWPARPKPAPK